jgi:hypothetical protein
MTNKTTIQRALTRTVLATIMSVAVTATFACHGNHRQFRSLATSAIPGDSSQYDIAFVEFDELGWYWNKAQEDSAIKLVEKRADETNTIVVVFAHGWHHTADCCDGNVVCFRTTLAKLRAELEQPIYRIARDSLTGDPRVRVVGIYAGWRGRSAPGLLDYLTFWSRKSTAERVGHADLRNLLTRLDAVYQERNSSGKGRFLGMVTVGHSFGGQAVFRAVSDLMESQLEVARPEPNSSGIVMRGLGDLVVLVNPAVEGAAMSPIDRAARNKPFDSLQTPVLSVFSAENDFPRTYLFPVGRILGAPVPARRSHDQRHLDRRALGVTRKLLSYELHWRPDSALPSAKLAMASVEKEPVVDGGQMCKPCGWDDTPPDDPVSTAGDSWIPPGQTAREPLLPSLWSKPRRVDFSRTLFLAGMELRPRVPQPPYFPFVVARSSSDIFSGHNGIFTRRFTTFLIRYVADIEGKRLLTREARIAALKAQPRQR